MNEFVTLFLAVRVEYLPFLPVLSFLFLSSYLMLTSLKLSSGKGLFMLLLKDLSYEVLN
eukprot:UN06980